MPNKRFLRIILIGFLIALIIGIVRYSELAYFTDRLSIKFYITIIAVLALGIGIWFGVMYSKRTVLVKYVEKSPASSAQKKGANHEALSKRESEILQYIASGYNNQEIADKLFLSLNTVKTHLNNIYIKLDVNSRTQAALKAQELDLI